MCYLAFLRKFFHLKVIGITGSAGKTTTKEMLASILKLKGKTVYSFANIDPVYNIPSTILKCTPWTKYLILEMGIEYPGEMDLYLWLARPDIGIITNISKTHTEFFQTIENVVIQKGKLVKSLGKSDFAVLNKTDLRLREMAKEIVAKVSWFGERGNVTASNITLTENGKTEFNLNIDGNREKAEIPILGHQFVENALAASAAAVICKVPIKLIIEGLANFERSPHRMHVIKHRSGALVVDDSYNSNPIAVKETLKTFMEIGRRKHKIVILGDMLELGPYQEESHRDLGKIVASLGIDFLVGVGGAAKVMVEEAQKIMGNNRVKAFNSQVKVYPFIKRFLKTGNIILIKGSKSMELNKVASKLE
jgi:UDP-N-acetylmuramoyl-tripeptide--D-alanyl-D-alanine ligase